MKGCCNPCIFQNSTNIYDATSPFNKQSLIKIATTIATMKYIWEISSKKYFFRKFYFRKNQGLTLLYSKTHLGKYFHKKKTVFGVQQGQLSAHCPTKRATLKEISTLNTTTITSTTTTITSTTITTNNNDPKSGEKLSKTAVCFSISCEVLRTPKGGSGLTAIWVLFLVCLWICTFQQQPGSWDTRFKRWPTFRLSCLSRQ